MILLIMLCWFTKTICDGVCGYEKWKTNYFVSQNVTFTETSILNVQPLSNLTRTSKQSVCSI